MNSKDLWKVKDRFLFVSLCKHRIRYLVENHIKNYKCGLESNVINILT